MKGFIFIVIILMVSVGGWFIINKIKQDRMLDSGRNVLLINKSKKLYSYSNVFDRSKLDGDVKPVAYVDDIKSEEQLRKFTKGYKFFSNKQEVFSQPKINLMIPDEKQADAWQLALTRITTDQKELCGVMPRADLSQACMFRHYIFELIKAGTGVEDCKAIYVNDFMNECQDIVNRNAVDLIKDGNGNNLLDYYESYFQA